MENYSQLLSEFQRIRSQMEKLKKERTDFLMKSLPDSFKTKLCELDDESLNEFAEEMFAILCRWEKSRKKSQYRQQLKKKKEQKPQKEEEEQKNTDDDEDISIADMLKDL